MVQPTGHGNPAGHIAGYDGKKWISDFDLLFDSQDPRVTDLDVSTTSPGKVSVVYKDPVDGKAIRIDFDVALVAGIWKITDVLYNRPEQVSLKRSCPGSFPDRWPRQINDF